VMTKDNRLFVEAVLYRYRAGTSWRDLQGRFGSFRVKNPARPGGRGIQMRVLVNHTRHTR